MHVQIYEDFGTVNSYNRNIYTIHVKIYGDWWNTK